jgi:DNA-binding HxlR family transcriptional regulator
MGLKNFLENLGAKMEAAYPLSSGHGAKRTGQLRRRVANVSDKMLIQHLKEKVDYGIIRRIDFQTFPPHVEYELTDFSHSLSEVLAPLCEWGTRHSPQVAIIVRNQIQASEAA